VHVLQGHLYLV